jgi:hypothetical protein
MNNTQLLSPSIFNIINKTQYGIENIDPIEYVYLLILINMITLLVVLLCISSILKTNKSQLNCIKIVKGIIDKLVDNININTHRIYDLNVEITILKEKIEYLEMKD